MLALRAAPGRLLGAGPAYSFRPAPGPWVCSPLPSSPYSSVPGSKLFPARLGLPGPGFAPPSSLALVAPFWGATFSCPAQCGAHFWPVPGPRVCSPLPASPCFSVLGSKLFPARRTTAPTSGRLPGPGFAPLSPLTLVLPFRGANFFLPGRGRRASGFAPLSPLALVLPFWGANFFRPGRGRRASGLLPSPR